MINDSNSIVRKAALIGILKLSRNLPVVFTDHHESSESEELKQSLKLVLKGTETCEVISTALLVANEVLANKLDVLNLMHSVMPKLLLPAWLKSLDNYTLVFNLIANYLRAFMYSKASEINEQLSTELNNFR